MENPNREVTKFLFVEMNDELDNAEEEIVPANPGLPGIEEGMDQSNEDWEDEVLLPDDIMPSFEDEDGHESDHKNKNISKKQKTWGPVQPARKSARVKGNLPIMEKAELLKMRKDLEIPKPSMKGIIDSNPFNVLPVEEIVDMTTTVVIIKEKLTC